MHKDTPVEQSQSRICEIQKDEETRIRFTPTKVVPKIPHLWDRKPSTPYKTRPKSRKLWKRFRSSFNSMKGFECVTGVTTNGAVDDISDGDGGGGGGFTYDSLCTEINGSKNWGFMRGVKRLCIGNGIGEAEGENFERGRSFLETKWEEEVVRKRRKLPVGARRPAVDNFQESGDKFGNEILADQISSTTDLDVGIAARISDGDSDSELQAMEVMKPTKEAPVESVHGDILRGSSNRLRTTEVSGLDVDSGDLCRSETIPQSPTEKPMRVNAVLPATEDVTMADGQHHGQVDDEDRSSTTATANTEDKSQGMGSGVQESPRLVQSALRNSLDREDTELLNEFVSKAMAKRAANAASAEENPEEPAEREPSKEDLVSEFPTPPPTRRVLKDLDINSPSPLRPQFSPSKAGHGTGAADGTDIPEPDSAANELAGSCTDEQQSPASPAVRRSSRARTPRQPPRITPPVVRGATISLRRPKGTEFIFQQRTEAQELALATRRNTKQNKGDAILPKGALKVMAEGQWCPEKETGRKSPTRRRASGVRKHVSWNEQRLAEYEGEEYSDDYDEVDENGPNEDEVVGKDSGRPSTTRPEDGRTKRANLKRRAKNENGNKHHDTKAATTPATPTSTSTATGRRVRRVAKSTSSTSSSDTKGSLGTLANTTARRRMLTPRAPSKATAVVEVTGQNHNGSRSTDTAKKNNNSSNNNNGNRKLMLTSNAGSTPVPKRFRSR